MLLFLEQGGERDRVTGNKFKLRFLICSSAAQSWVMMPLTQQQAFSLRNSQMTEKISSLLSLGGESCGSRRSQGDRGTERSRGHNSWAESSWTTRSSDLLNKR